MARGGDNTAYYGSLSLVGIPTFLYFLFVGSELVVPFGWVGNFAVAILAASTLGNLISAHATDPGTIPTNPKPPHFDDEEGYGSAEVPSYRDVAVNGAIVRTTYCTACHIYRPPRASHCRDCDRCILVHDHHCEWIGNCVGLRNYRPFVVFLASLCSLCVAVFACCVAQLVWLAKLSDEPDAAIHAIKACPVGLLLALFCPASFFAVVGLFSFHLWLVASALTTHEHVRDSLRRHNPYRKGMARNILERLCTPIPPSFPFRPRAI